MKGIEYKKSKVDVATSIFGWISFALAVILAVATFFSILSDSKSEKEVFGVKMFIVQTDSMSKGENIDEEIFFNAGDVIFIKKVEDATKLEVGDVIAFISVNADSYGKTLTHKIKEIKYNSVGKLIGYVTYGVRTGESDQTLVQPDYVIGEYAGKVPAVGHFFAFLKTKSGYYTCILLPCAMLIIHFSIKVGRLIERRYLSNVGLLTEPTEKESPKEKDKEKDKVTKEKTKK